MWAKLSGVWTPTRMGGCGRCSGRGHHREVLDLVERAVVAEALLRPRQADDLEASSKRARFSATGTPEAVELGGDGAAADAELQPAAGEQIGGRGLLRAGSADGAAATG